MLMVSILGIREECAKPVFSKESWHTETVKAGVINLESETQFKQRVYFMSCAIKDAGYENELIKKTSEISSLPSDEISLVFLKQREKETRRGYEFLAVFSQHTSQP